MVDLADMLAGMVVTGARTATLRHYLDALHQAGIEDVAQVRATLPAAAVITFTKWTCGVATWEPVAPRSQQALDALIDRAAATATWVG